MHTAGNARMYVCVPLSWKLSGVGVSGSSAALRRACGLECYRFARGREREVGMLPDDDRGGEAGWVGYLNNDGIFGNSW